MPDRRFKPNDIFKPRDRQETSNNRRSENREKEIDNRRNVPQTSESDRNALERDLRIDILEKQLAKSQKQLKEKSKSKAKPSNQPATLQNEKLTPTDVFLGRNDFINDTSDIAEVKKILKAPHAISIVSCKTKQFRQDKMPEDRRCRNLIITIDPKHYMTTDNDLFKENGDISANNKYNQAITEIKTNLETAVNFYKPDQTFVQITDQVNPTTFWGIVKLVCHIQKYVAMELNPTYRNHLATIDDKKIRSYVWRSRIKEYLQNYHPKIRDLTKMSPDKMINY